MQLFRATLRFVLHFAIVGALLVEICFEVLASNDQITGEGNASWDGGPCSLLWWTGLIFSA